ncbi:type IV pilin protein [Haliea sp. E17]|uniref:type IV pilin protein n=1 Tax=Haliea sp. E17 TaxID=3401576 RepID=UPI003AAC06D6
MRIIRGQCAMRAGFAIRQHSGFSLIELMTVLIVVAVLMAIALPSYQNHVIKANRGEAQAYLMHLAQRQQLLFNDSRTYTDDPNDLNVTEPERVTNNYDVAIAANVDPNSPPFTFTITATPKGKQTKDGILSLDSSGQKLRGADSW